MRVFSDPSRLERLWFGFKKHKFLVCDWAQNLNMKFKCITHQVPHHDLHFTFHPCYIKVTLLPALALNVGIGHKGCSVE